MLKLMHKDFTANNCSGTSQRSHCHVSSWALEHTAHSALLVLCWHVCRRWGDIGETSTTAYAIGSAKRSHCHTDRATKNHRLLVHDGLLWIVWSVLWRLLWVLGIWLRV